MKISKAFSVVALLICLFAIQDNTFARTYLVAAEVNDYPGTDRDIKMYSWNSVKDIEAAFRKSDSTLVCTKLINNQVTNYNLLSAIRILFANADTGDNVVLYIHGHGYNGGYSTYDGWLSYSQLREAMATCKSRHKMIFADCCHSGSLRGKTQDTVRTQQEQKAAQKSKVMLFLSSRDSEVSFVASKYGEGYFTAYLCKALKGEADVDGDKIVTARELYIFVKKGVVRETSEECSSVQHPVMWGNFPDNMPIILLSTNPE